jgi:hypothetical protein
VGDIPGVGVDPGGFVSAVEDGEEGFVPATLGILDFSFSSDFFERDSASESVSSYKLIRYRVCKPLKHKDFLPLHQCRNLPFLQVFSDTVSFVFLLS